MILCSSCKSSNIEKVNTKKVKCMDCGNVFILKKHHIKNENTLKSHINKNFLELRK